MTIRRVVNSVIAKKIELATPMTVSVALACWSWSSAVINSPLRYAGKKSLTRSETVSNGFSYRSTWPRMATERKMTGMIAIRTLKAIACANRKMGLSAICRYSPAA